MSDRPKMFEGLDPSAFKSEVAKPTKAVVDAAVENGFRSRETRDEPESSGPIRSRRRARSERTQQISIKTTPAAVRTFYEICDAEDWVLAAGFERAVELLKREFDNGRL